MYKLDKILVRMVKKLITVAINEKLIKVNFADIRRIISRKPVKYPKLPHFSDSLALKNEGRTEEI